jgi:thymus-specific serine protease
MKFLLIFLLSLQLSSNRADLLTHKLFNSFDADKFLPKDAKVSPALALDVIHQRVDHFNPQNFQTFEQYFFTNDEFFQPGGPIVVFLYISPIAHLLGGAIYLSFGPVHDFARELNGTLVAPQHRYFEGSRVTEDLSKENLRFLTVSQVLEDLAHLISELKERNGYEKSGEVLT